MPCEIWRKGVRILSIIISKHAIKGNQYTVIDADMTYDTVNLVQKQLDLMLDDESIDQNTYDYLYPLEHKTRTPHCNFLPKILKNTPPDRVFIGRPVDSNCGGPCEKISEFIDYFLVPPRAKTTSLLEGHERCDKKN